VIPNIKTPSPSMISRKLYITYLFAILSMVCWGLSFVWIKIVYIYYHPLTAIFLRLVISSILLYVVVRLLKKRQKIDKADYKTFLILAFIEPFCYFLGESYGLSMNVSSTVASVIIATIPVFTPIAAYFTFREKLTPLNYFGLFISFVGVLIMVINNDFSFAADPLGVLLLFFAVLSAMFYAVYIKKLTHKYNVFTILSVQNLIGAIYFLPLFLVFDFGHFITIKPTRELITALLQLSIFASTLAFLLFIPVVRDLGMTRANIFANFIPVFTAIFSYFILSEVLSFNKIMGMVIVISGVLLTNVGNLINFGRNYFSKKEDKNR
jgi:drug/metabolite transporter (DMT)-like permease